MSLVSYTLHDFDMITIGLAHLLLLLMVVGMVSSDETVSLGLFPIDLL